MSRPTARRAVAAWSRYTAAIAALCLGLSVVPASAEDPVFVLLPDKSLGSLDTDPGSPDTGTMEPPPRLRRDWIGLGRDTLLLFGYQLVGIGVLYVMPADTTGWDSEQKKATFGNWWENVTHPEWDKDIWYVNYIGHTYFGSAYYTRARERGFTRIDSFIYAALGSAIYEFGVEAVFEPPSYQDLIVTPVGGALLGLALEPVRDWVKRKPETPWYGHVILVATDPIGALNYVVERLVGIKSDIRVDVGRDTKFRVELRMLLD